jgi:hypothetical protein
MPQLRGNEPILGLKDLEDTKQVGQYIRWVLTID